MSQTTQQIPVGWKMVNFNEYINLQYGSNLPKDKRENGLIPVYGSNGITDYHNKPLVNGPGIIVGRKGSIGLIHWSDNDFWPIDTTYYISDDKNKNLRWIYYKLQTLGLDEMNSASGVPGLNRNEVYSLKITIPPLSEQNKITTILSKVDEEIEKVEQIINQTEKLKKGLMQKLLTKGISHTKFKQTELGEIPEEWEVVKLGAISIINPKIDLKVLDKSEKVGFITMTDTSNSGQINNIQERKLEEVSKGFTKFQDKDVLFAKITPCMENGKGGLLLDSKYRYYFGSTEFHIIRESKRINHYFIHYLVNNSSFRKLASGHMSGTAGQKRVPKEFLENHPIALPPIAEQLKIAAIFFSIDNKVSIYNKVRFHLSKLKKGLMNDLLSGRIRTRI